MKLDLPYCQQKSDSACCGPCCIKMLADYYKVVKPSGEPYSKMSLVKLGNCTKESGTSFNDMNKLLSMLGLLRTKVKTLKDIKDSIKRGEPILTLIPDIKEAGAFHYIIIKGINPVKDEFDVDLIVQDPYWGEHTVLSWYALHLIEVAGNWMWSIRRSNAKTI